MSYPMAREIRVKRDKSHLGDSWVVNESSENDDASDSSDGKEITVAPKTTRSAASFHDDPLESPPDRLPSQPRRRPSRASSRDPEFIMPSIHDDGMVGSWASSTGTRASKAKESPRKRKTQTGTYSAVGDDQSQGRRGAATKKQSPRQSAKEPSSAFADGLASVVKPVFEFCFEIIGGAIRALKRPLSYAMALYLFLGLLTLVGNLVTSSIYTALSPICRIPGTSFLNLPMCQGPFGSDHPPSPDAPVEFDQLMTVQSHFEEILERSAVGISLPLDMKRGETSIRDLRQVVRFSHLQSRNELVLEFDGFIETARMASYDLQKFNSHVGRAVDNVLATARWTRRVLDNIATERSSRGLIPSFINDRLLAPFQPINNRFSETALLDQYISHTRVVEEEINRLISEAQALLLVLNNLEDRLEVIHGISLRENIHVQGSKDEVLTSLWTLLGGNRMALGKYNSQLALLRRVGEYRKTAWAHVSGTIIRLQAMGAELEELRERVGSAELLRDHTEIPLAVHIENIEMGVDRLEQGRSNAKKLEREHLKRVLDRGLGAGEEEGRLVDG